MRGPRCGDALRRATLRYRVAGPLRSSQEKSEQPKKKPKAASAPKKPATPLQELKTAERNISGLVQKVQKVLNSMKNIEDKVATDTGVISGLEDGLGRAMGWIREKTEFQLLSASDDKMLQSLLASATEVSNSIQPILAQAAIRVKKVKK